MERIKDSHTLYVKAYNANFKQIIEAFDRSLEKYEKIMNRKFKCHFIGRMWKTNNGLSRAYIYVTNTEIFNLILNKIENNIDWSINPKEGIKSKYPSPFFIPNKEQLTFLESINITKPFYFKCSHASITPLNENKEKKEFTLYAENIPKWLNIEDFKKKFNIIANENNKLKPSISLINDKIIIRYTEFFHELNFIYYVLKSVYFTKNKNKCIVQLKIA